MELSQHVTPRKAADVSEMYHIVGEGRVTSAGRCLHQDRRTRLGCDSYKTPIVPCHFREEP